MTTPSATIPELPPECWIDRLVLLLAPISRVTQPKLYGAEHVPADGSLLVGNHTIYGILDLPFMMADLWKRRRGAVRGLGEHAHYAVPVWRDLLAVGGMVGGTRENVRELMRQRQTIVVFPGGARGNSRRILARARRAPCPAASRSPCRSTTASWPMSASSSERPRA